MKTPFHILSKIYLSLSLRNKFIIPAVAVIFVSFLSVSIYFIHDQRTEQEIRLQEKAERITRLLLSSNLESIWDVDLKTLERNCQTFFEDEEITRLVITDTFYGNEELINLSKEISGTRDIVMTADFIKGDQRVAKLKVVFSNYYIEQNLMQLRNTLAVFSLLMFIMMVGLINTVLYIALRPLKELMKGVEHLTAGDLKFRIPLQSQDELGKLAQSFNTMAEELSLFHNHLRVLVDQRTTELKTVNEQLYQEISEKKRAESLLLESKETAEEANRTKSVFLANMSHELRTPLNAIIGFSELMTRHRGLPSEHSKNLATIVRSGEHLLSLINDVLELSKIEVGRVELHPENFNLHKFLDDLEEMFRLRVRQKRLTLDFVCGDNVPHAIRADQSKLRQILNNLLSNAVKFTESGGITLRVNNNATEENASIETCSLLFEVIDSGTGVIDNEQEKVFEAFFQTSDEHSHNQGTGLGLPISRKFVNMMGGNLTLQSESDTGSKFSFTIKVHPVAITDVPSPETKDRVIGLEEGQQNYRLLVVEDNENSRNLLVNLLQAVGFTVSEAKDGVEAVEIWQKWQPHLVFMDLRMPMMDGYETITRIKTLQGGTDTIIIVLTASAFEEDRLKVIEHGGNDFIRKPFREYEIFKMLAKHLDVKFVYEKKVRSNQNRLAMAETEQIISGIKVFPDDLQTDLRKAVMALDFDATMSIVSKIREQNEDLADALTEYVNAYQFDKLQNIFES